MHAGDIFLELPLPLWSNPYAREGTRIQGKAALVSAFCRTIQKDKL